MPGPTDSVAHVHSLSLEETISTHLPYLQRCESDRLRAATSVLRSFHAAIAALPKLIDASLERVGQALELCRPEKDLRAIMERRRYVSGALTTSFHCA